MPRSRRRARAAEGQQPQEEPAPPEAPEEDVPEAAERPREPAPAFVTLPVFLAFAAGLVTGVALALGAFLVFYLLREETAAQPAAQPDIAQPTPVATAISAADAVPRTTAVLTVRIGPGSDYAALGTLARGEAVEVVGRNHDATWLAVRFPPGSAASGWVPAAGVSGVNDIQGLAVTFPTPLPFLPTFPPPSGFLPEAPTGATPTPTPVRLPDLVISAVQRLPDGRLSVTVTNRGGDLRDRFIRVRVGDIVGEYEDLTAPRTELAAGASVDLTTSRYVVLADKTVVATVNPDGSAPEQSLANNTLQVEIKVPPSP